MPGNRFGDLCLFDFATWKRRRLTSHLDALGESVGRLRSVTAAEEPVIYCLQSDAGSLTENCDQADTVWENPWIEKKLAGNPLEILILKVQRFDIHRG